MMELHALFKGKVQGVGFRWTVVEAATQFGLVGLVQNLEDGSVEVYAQGAQQALEALVQAIQKDSGNARIDSCMTVYGQPTQSFKDFSIL